MKIRRTVAQQARRCRQLKTEALEQRLALTAELVSFGIDESADAYASPLQMSDDGKYTLFETAATNLSSSDTNGGIDFYRYDRATGAVELVSVSPVTGLAGSSEPWGAVMSSDGEIVAFASSAPDMTGQEGAGPANVFVRNMRSGQTHLVTRRLDDSTGHQDVIQMSSLRMSRDGRQLVFSTTANELVPNDSNGTSDVFTWSLDDQELTLVSHRRDGGGPANGDSSEPWISADGVSVIFASDASDLAFEAPAAWYRANLETGEVRTVPTMPVASNKFLSSDGSFVLFSSDASEEVPLGGIYVRDLATGTTNAILNDTFTLVGLTADDQRVLAVRDDDVVRQIAIWDFVSQTQSDIAVGNLSDSSFNVAAYDHTGDKIVVNTRGFFEGRLEMIDIGTGRWTSLPTNMLAESYPNDPVVISGDGSYVGMVAYAKPSSVSAIVPNRYSDVSDDRLDIPQLYVISSTQSEGYLASRSEEPGIITDEGLANWAHSPFTSDDGHYVGFLGASRRDIPFGGIFLVDRQTGERMVISVTRNGVISNPQISDDGQRVAFQSCASDLVPLDLNGVCDVFAFDTRSRAVELVTVSDTGIQANEGVESYILSKDGSSIVFTTRSNNLAVGDDNQDIDIYRRDLISRTTSLISVNSDTGQIGNRPPLLQAVSADGTRILFSSASTNLVPSDLNLKADLFLYDVNMHQTILVSRSPLGGAGNAETTRGVLSDDGNHVAFASHASDLVTDDSNGTVDVFVFSVAEGTTELVSRTPIGLSGNGQSYAPSISDDGRFIAFTTDATDLGLGSNPVGVFVRDLAQKSTVELAKYNQAPSLARTFEVQGDRLAVSLLGGFGEVELPFPVSHQIWSKDRLTTVYVSDDIRVSRVYVEEATPPAVDRMFQSNSTTLDGNFSRDVDVADLDGDGDVDIFVTNDSTVGNYVLVNAIGTFRDSRQRLGSMRSIYSTLGDIDGDGDVDAIVATRNGTHVWRNDGTGVFEDTLQQLGDDLHLDPALGDVDRDGDLDLFIATTQGQLDRLFLNNGSGEFVDSGQVLSTTDSKSAVFADVNGDTWLDVVVGTAGANGGPNLVWLNAGDGTLVDSGQRLGSEQTQHLEPVDLDGDGDLDLYTANSHSANQPDFIWINDGTGVFWDSGQRIGNVPTSHVAFADVDEDGDLDAMAVNYGTGGNRLWLNIGDGTFVDSFEAFGNSNSEHGVFADVDGDGDPDFIAANISSPNSIVRNASRMPPPPIPPELTEDEYSIPADAVLIVGPELGLLSNDHTVTNGELQVSAMDLQSVHLATINGGTDGAFSFDPRTIPQAIALPAGASLVDSFEYSAIDHRGLESHSTARVYVMGVNDSPLARPDSLEMASDARALDITSTLLANDDDPDDGETAQLVVGSLLLQGTRGHVSLANGRVWYEPGEAFDSLAFSERAADLFRYSLVDPFGATFEANVTITVIGASKVPGDSNRNGVLDANDTDLMCGAVRTGNTDSLFDLNGNGSVSLADFNVLIDDLFGSSEGDSNLDRIFNSSDLILVFQQGEYEDGIAANSTWRSGDWNCDQEFDTADIVRAFQAGGYVSSATRIARSMVAAAIGDELQTSERGNSLKLGRTISSDAVGGKSILAAARR